VLSFSGGENQKISIARALYKDGAVMVLDEPTAALDALAENRIYMSFNQMVQEKRRFISHTGWRLPVFVMRLPCLKRVNS